MERIAVRNLEIYAKHGVYEEENRLGQPFFISADLYVDTWEAAHTDRLEASVDYGSVCHMITEEMQNNTFKLIERAAAHVCELLLERFSPIQEAVLRLYKPQAPIGLPFETVYIETRRKWTDVFLSIGSNMGDRDAAVDGAIEALRKTPGIRLIDISKIIETEPYGYTAQDKFLNGALWIKTYLPPEILLNRLHDIEQQFHRERIIRWGPRTLDLDIIFYGKEIIDSPELSVPHIDMANRLFVLEPLTEIGGWFRHPLLNLTVSELYQRLRKEERGND